MIRPTLLASAVLLVAAAAGAQEIVRHPIPGSDFPISRAVEIPPGATLVYLSGAVPSVVDASAEPGAQAAYGDTAEQTRSVLRAIEATLGDIGLGLGDVVKMQAYLVAPEAGGAMDFQGFMAGYTEFFGTGSQPNLPTRSVFEVAGLANPGWLVEIEVVAARP